MREIEDLLGMLGSLQPGEMDAEYNDVPDEFELLSIMGEDDIDSALIQEPEELNPFEMLRGQLLSSIIAQQEANAAFLERAKRENEEQFKQTEIVRNPPKPTGPPPMASPQPQSPGSLDPFSMMGGGLNPGQGQQGF